jgi:hypothetical protein
MHTEADEMTHHVTTIPIIKARDRLTSLPEELSEDPGAIAVTRRGEPALAILP